MTSIAKNLRYLGLLLIAILLTGTVGFSILEGMSLLNALYFSVATVATVGYGDIHPVTPQGKILAVLIIIVGVGTFLGVMANGTEFLLEKRQKEERREKLNMVVGLFFAEIGFELLRHLARADAECGDVRATLAVKGNWTDKDYAQARKALEQLCMKIDPGLVRFEELKEFLNRKSDLLLRILENPSLSEHGSFTDIIRAVFHLKAELVERESFGNLPPSDLSHLALDAERGYRPLTLAWLHHLQYLKKNYPYLYSLAVRTNPFLPSPDPVVRG